LQISVFQKQRKMQGQELALPEGSVPRKVKWTESEDRILEDKVAEHGTGNWTVIASFISGRTGKQCRERWVNQFEPSLSKSMWTNCEDAILVTAHRHLGNAWAKIAQYLPGRSCNSVKNRWIWLRRHSTQLMQLSFEPTFQIIPITVPLPFCFPGPMR
jgi:hypothetical protein